MTKANPNGDLPASSPQTPETIAKIVSYALSELSSNVQVNYLAHEVIPTSPTYRLRCLIETGRGLLARAITAFRGREQRKSSRLSGV